jgi:hypothetical protein
LGLAAAAQPELLPQLIADPDVGRFIGLHTSNGYQWFIQERWELLLAWLEITALVAAAGDGLPARAAAAATARKRLRKAAADAGYRLDRLLVRVK